MRRSGWYRHGLEAIERVARKQRFLCVDDVREDLEAHDHDDPPHPNAVGALFNEAQKQHLIVKTGEFVQSSREPAKGRNVQIWESRLYTRTALDEEVTELHGGELARTTALESFRQDREASDQGSLL